MCLATVSEKSIFWAANRKKISHLTMNHTCRDLHPIAYSPAWLRMWLLQSLFCAKGEGGINAYKYKLQYVSRETI